MTLTIELSQSEEERLSERAALAGLDLVTYIKSLIDATSSNANETNDSLGRLIAKISKPAPVIDLTREGIYADF